MSLSRLMQRLSLGILITAWAVSCASGEENASDELPPAKTQGGSGGQEEEAGSGGTPTAGKGGSTFPTDGGTGGSTAGNNTFPGDGGTGGAGGTPPAAGEFGAKCAGPDSCNSKMCTEVGNSKSPNQICTQACDASGGCPTDSHCVEIDKVGPVCVPDRESACGLCTKDSDCLNQGDRCLLSGSGQTYCAQDCSVDDKCPTGFECKPPPGALQGIKACTLLTGTDCPCAPNRDKYERACTKKIGDKVCGGLESCNGSLGAYEGCNAPDPAPEICDGKDNDCDGKIDNPPGASCKCEGNDCTVVCNTGFTRYPTTLPESDGCPCPLDTGEPDKGGTCTTPRNVTEISDSGPKTSLSLTGTISSDDDVDWFKITIKDLPESNTNTYHARISFDTNPDNEFVFKVIRGNDCSQEAAVPAITSYDLCVNFQSGTTGLKSCQNKGNGVPDCQDMSADYLVGVRRNPSASTKTCKKYSVKFEGNAGPCEESSFDACGGQFGPKAP